MRSSAIRGRRPTCPRWATSGGIRERVAAIQEFRANVEKGTYPEDKHLVPIADAEFESFVKGLEKR
jgi:ketopantoate hydroxymethyltransferase